MVKDIPANDNDPSHPTDTTVDGPWKDASRDQIRREFEAFHRDNPFPENFRGVARHVKPPTSALPEIIVRFSVRVPERHGQRAPCNICNVESKFESQGRLARDERGWLYFIGPICAARYYDDYEAAEQVLRDRENRERAEAFLWESLPTVPLWRQVCADMLPMCEEADAANKQLRTKCRSFLEVLRSALGPNGLTVDDEQMVQMADGRSYSRGYRRRVEHFSGRRALDHSSLVANLTRAIQGLDILATADEDELLERMAATEADDKLVQTRAFFNKTVGRVKDAYDGMKQQRSFYHDSNFAAMRRWNDHQLGPQSFGIEARSNTRTIHTPEGDRFWFKFERLLGPLPNLPG